MERILYLNTMIHKHAQEDILNTCRYRLGKWAVYHM